MKVFHLLTITFLLACTLKHLLAENIDQKRSDFENRLNQAQALLNAIKTKSSNRFPGSSSEGDHSQSGILSPPRNQTLPLSRSLKIKKLRERVNRAEGLLHSVAPSSKPDVRVGPEINSQDIPPRPPTFISGADQAPQVLSAPQAPGIVGAGNRMEPADAFSGGITGTDHLSGFHQQAEEEINVPTVPISEPSVPDSLSDFDSDKPAVGEFDKAGLFEGLDRNSSFGGIYPLEDSKEFAPHEVRFLYSYVYPFSSTFISTGGEGVPLDYDSGFQGEIQYLYRFSFLSLGCSVLWSEQSHKTLGPLSFFGYTEARGETRSFGGSLLARISTDLGDHFSVESVLSLGLVRRLDKFQMAGVYMSEAGNSLLSSLSVGLHYHFFSDYKLGLFTKCQDLDGLSRNSESQALQVGASIGLEF